MTAVKLLVAALLAAAPVAASADDAVGEAIAVGGVTLRSLSVPLPQGAEAFTGPGAEAINNNCLACHSPGMVLTQPALSRQTWQAEVDKMRKVYKANVTDEDVPAIVDYLVRLAGTK